jgi:hypothetical protein
MIKRTIACVLLIETDDSRLDPMTADETDESTACAAIAYALTGETRFVNEPHIIAIASEAEARLMVQAHKFALEIATSMGNMSREHALNILTDKICVPGYWMNETSGVLRPAIEAYLNGGAMTDEQIAAVRAYLRQWVAADRQPSDALDRLRAGVNTLVTRKKIEAWLNDALALNIDPL